MVTDLESAVFKLSERVVQNYKDIRQSKVLRRNQTVDIYGSEFYRQGSGDAPATFYISVSPDMVYMERFEFKLIISSFTSTVTGASVGEASVVVDDTELTVGKTTATAGQEHTHSLTPNPHTHTTIPHTHNVIANGGISQIITTADDFRIKIDGIDITAYLMAQYDGDWIEGEGVYPSLEIDKDYDILEVASDMMAEGRTADAKKLMSSGYKLVQVSSSQPFSCTMVLYLKYNHLNR